MLNQLGTRRTVSALVTFLFILLKSLFQAQCFALPTSLASTRIIAIGQKNGHN